MVWRLAIIWFAVFPAFCGDAAAQVSAGTGFVVNRAGWVLTNAHVVEGCGTVEVGPGLSGTVLLRDEALDLAVVKAPLRPDLQPLVFRTAPPRLVEDVVALGFPLSDVLATTIKTTTGTISALAGLRDDSSRLQFSAPVQPGNSGGPLIDREGLVVGVVTSRLSEDRFAGAQNVNFAIKAEVAAAYLEAEGIAHERAERGDAGASLSDVVEAAAAATLPILCRPTVSAPAPKPVASPEPAAMRFILADGQDIVGHDYRQVPDVPLFDCAVTCDLDPGCAAYTYNTRHRLCLLKSGASYLAAHPDALSAYRREIAQQVRRTSIAVFPNRDAPGGDYARRQRTNYVTCFLDCAADPMCRAFAYVRATRTCWLKDRPGQAVPARGVELGIK